MYCLDDKMANICVHGIAVAADVSANCRKVKQKMSSAILL